MSHHPPSGPRDDCPLCCRARLAGTLSRDPSISKRTLAVLAAGLLAVPAGAPATGLAQEQEPDQAQEGVVVPEQPEGQDREVPDFDPGGDTALPFEVGPAPATPEDESPDAGPIETEPIDDPGARLAPLGEPEPPSSGLGDAPVAPTEDPAPVEGTPPAAPPAPGFPIEPAPPVGAEPKPQDLGVEPGGRETEKASPPGVQLERPVSRSTQASPPTGPTSQAQTAPADEAAPGDDAPAADVAQTDDRRESAPTRGRVHVVQPGESLWTIAEGSLGADASAVRVAREVARLWMLNDDRIATGDPDMIMVGTRLRLR